MTGETNIYYFGYGPIVNSIVRSRRGLHLTNERPAVLPEYRLTFAFGGVANVIRQRGYDVHGIVMKVDSDEDWKKLKEFESAHFQIEEDVFPYDNPDKPIRAYVMVLTEYDKFKLDGPIEKLPQERYLKLIAQGMRTYKLDEDYVEDQIMSCPFVPARKPENYYKYSYAQEPLPKITFQKYEKLCRNGSEPLFFLLGDEVLRVGEHEAGHPGVKWIEEKGHGKPDVTFALHQTVVDPDIPFVDRAEDITPAHVAWAENHLVEFMDQCGYSATKVFVVSDDAEDEEESRGFICCCFGRKKTTALGPGSLRAPEASASSSSVGDPLAVEDVGETVDLSENGDT